MKNIINDLCLILMAAAHLPSRTCRRPLAHPHPSQPAALSPAGPAQPSLRFTLTDSGPYYVVWMIVFIAHHSTQLHGLHREPVLRRGPGSTVISPFDPSTLSEPASSTSIAPTRSIASLGIINIPVRPLLENPNDPNFDPDSWLVRYIE